MNGPMIYVSSFRAIAWTKLCNRVVCHEDLATGNSSTTGKIFTLMWEQFSTGRTQ
ncbi:hypothetical protein PAXRUDRAFT_833604 [Paxillus rubicundulus Ve08.2h10]|uniref:Uncharacterized protein n=1 Tax=Paxillus rubicundulus Ve08.2h10 TaxID=930991 RepID=A0A0D0DNQ6_9AGAM|nr:hypothetical protein PAXRUDRAFT_833604 [Paxillus rubicundulus Ve08.2h10]